ncbi:MAG TPA: MG2 domain-containing protein, partial [Pyrinomonadaceae bacterium]
LAVTNPTGGELKARVLLEVLDPQGALCASSLTDELLRRGSSALLISLPLKLAGLNAEERKAVLWYRLRYRITTEQSARDEALSAEGIVSLSEITPDLFELRVAAAERAREGMHYHARARAIHPISSRAVAGVSVEGELAFNDSTNKGSIKSSGITDADGYAPLDFDLPKRINDDDELELKVRASHGGLTEEVEEDIRLERDALIMLTTDKTLYQPGQMLHMRALCFDGSKHALANVSGQLIVEDPEETTVFRAPLLTSRFGIASLDWPIPESTRLGDYIVKLELDDGRYSDQQAQQTIKISRYELPNFAVNVHPDRTFYLPGQEAEVEVRADYLFGQPVKRGHVRVVREEERRWNYQEQKWDTKEAETYEGETDADGRFRAHINLGQEHRDLSAEDYSRYRDLSYAAYFTDPTTNRTEQRRFVLRLTKDPIHIYIFSGIERQTKNFPLQFYLSTYYADGTPAQCDVEITDARGSSDSQHATAAQPLRTIKTNRFGVAKVEALALPVTDDDNDNRSVSLNFVARDKAGASGSQANDFWLTSSPVIRLETDKVLYRAGAPIKATITASQPRMKLMVDVWRGEMSLRSQAVELHDGQARISIPYSAEFKDGVALT